LANEEKLANAEKILADKEVVKRVEKVSFPLYELLPNDEVRLYPTIKAVEIHPITSQEEQITIKGA